MKERRFIESVIAWTLTIVFVFTAILTCGSLVGWVHFENPSHQNKLFYALIVEVVAVAVGYFRGILRYRYVENTEREHNNNEPSGIFYETDSKRGLIPTQPSSSIIQKWDDAEFATRVKEAHDLWFLAVANYDFLAKHAISLKRILIKGGSIRGLYVRPNTEAFRMATVQGYGCEKKPGHVEDIFRLSINKLREFSQETGVTTRIEVKTVNHLPSCIMTFLDPEEAEGCTFVTFHGYGHDHTTRPSILVRRSIDMTWFDWFLKMYENIWNSDGVKIINLASGYSTSPTNHEGRL